MLTAHVKRIPILVRTVPGVLDVRFAEEQASAMLSGSAD
jgi:hypothetical protein